MTYLLLVYRDETTPLDDAAMMRGCGGLAERLTDEGIYGGGHRLHGTESATCVKVRNGVRLVTDGPFAETREALGGTMLVEARDLDHAIAIAAEHPVAELGTIEVRPVLDPSTLVDPLVHVHRYPFAASREDLWRVGSDPARRREWLVENPEDMVVDDAVFEVGVPYRHIFRTPHGEMEMTGEILDIVPGHSFSRTQNCGGAGTMRFDAEFRDAPWGSELVSTIRFATPEEAANAPFMDAGMDGALARLQALLDKETGVAPFRTERTFAAPAERIRKALVGPEIARWLGPDDMPTEITEYVPGHRTRYRMATMDAAWFWHDVSRPDRLIYTSAFTDERGEIAPAPFPGPWPIRTLNILRFAEADGQTRVSLESRPYADETPERIAAFVAEIPGMEIGFGKSFDNLDRLLGFDCGGFGPPAGDEHAFLRRLVGEWHGVSGFVAGDVQRWSALGDFHVVCEATGAMGDARIVLGFDPRVGRFVGHWAGSMMPFPFPYLGDRDGDRLVLESEGPAMDGSPASATYRDSMIFVGDDAFDFVAEYRADGDDWQPLMHGRFRRA